jgi:hypothetical protein
LFKQKTNILNPKCKTIRKLVFVFFVLFFSISLFFILKNTVFAQVNGEFSGISNEVLQSARVSDEAIEKLNKTGFGPDSTPSNDETCSILHLPRCFILVMFKFAGFLLTLSGTVFVWIIDTDNIKLILNGTSTSNPIYEVWTYVRDLLNMAFIMILLFSAFCTIFQVEQYNYKKLLWKIVLMALLVNFSFPITRFIIDASNILMYSLINSDLISSAAPTITSFFANIAKSNGALANLLESRNFTDNTSLLAATIMIFMLAITLLAIGILLLVRMIALAILIIFSPIAFVGTILPGASSYASKWWDNLFKYSFFGPIMILGVVIAIKLMNGIGDSLRTSANSAATGLVTANIIGNVAYIALPIVLLWIVMGVAQSMSIAGAGAVIGAAQGAMKWSAKNLTGYRIAKAAGGAGAHWLNRKLAETKGLRYLSPMAMKEAWKLRTTRQDRKALAASTGTIQNTLNKVIGHAASLNPFIAINRLKKGGLKNVFQPMDMDKDDYEDIDRQRYANEMKKEFGDTNENSAYVLHRMGLALERKESGDEGIVIGGQMVLAKSNDFNDYGASRGLGTDPQKIKTELIRDLRNAGISKTESIAKSLMVTGEIAFNSGGFGYGGMGEFITKNNEDLRENINLSNYRTLDELGHLEKLEEENKKDPTVKIEFANPTFKKALPAGFYFTTEEKQAEIGKTKFSNYEPQQRQRTAHSDSFYVTRNGIVEDIHPIGEQMFQPIHGGDIKEAGRARDTGERHAQAWDLYSSGPGQNEEFKEKINTINKKNPAVKPYLEKMWRLQHNIPEPKDTDKSEASPLVDSHGRPYSKQT